MKLLRREEVWIHTHFVTDCAYLPEHFARDIRRKMDRLLDKLGIVFGIHFHSGREEGLCIVLECIPFPETMTKIESALKDIAEPIPSRPRKTRVDIEPPGRRASARVG
jgi:hypothetical protein